VENLNFLLLHAKVYPLPLYYITAVQNNSHPSFLDGYVFDFAPYCSRAEIRFRSSVPAHAVENR